MLCEPPAPAKDATCNAFQCPSWTSSYSTTCTFVSCQGDRGVLKRWAANCAVASSSVPTTFFSSDQSSAAIAAGCPTTVPSSTLPCDSAAFDDVCNVAADKFVWLAEPFVVSKCSTTCPDTLHREVACFKNGKAAEETECSAESKPASMFICPNPKSACKHTATCDGNVCNCPHGFLGSTCEVTPTLAHLTINNGASDVDGTSTLPRCPSCEFTIKWEYSGGSESDIMVSLLFASVDNPGTTFPLDLVPAGQKQYTGRIPEDLPVGMYTFMAYLGELITPTHSGHFQINAMCGYIVCQNGMPCKGIGCDCGADFTGHFCQDNVPQSCTIQCQPFEKCPDGFLCPTPEPNLLCTFCKQDRSKSLMFANLSTDVSPTICAALTTATKGVLQKAQLNTLGMTISCDVSALGEGKLAATLALSSRLEYLPNGTLLNFNGARRRLLVASSSLDNIIASFKVVQEQSQDPNSDLLNSPQLKRLTVSIVTAQPTSSPTKRTMQPTMQPTSFPTVPGTRIDGCENTRVTYSCPPDTVINVTSSKFGRRDKISVCDVERATCNTQADVTSFMHGACQQRQRCSVYVHMKDLGVADPCPGVRKVLQTSILCLDPDTGKIIDSSSTNPTPAVGVNSYASVCPADRLKLTCGKNAVISSVKASFGRQTDKTRCIRTGNSVQSCTQTTDASNIFQSCIGQPSCSVAIKTSLFTDLSCTHAYLLPGTFVCALPTVHGK